MYLLRTSALALLVTCAGAFATSGRLRTSNAPLVLDGTPSKNTPDEQRTFRTIVNELATKVTERFPARAVSFARLAGIQDPENIAKESEKIAKESHQVGEEVATEGATGLFLFSPLEILIQALLGLVLLVLFAILYKKYKTTCMVDDVDSKGTPADLDGVWKYGFCDCLSAPRTCCIACCFPAVRWADTIDMSKQLSFWAAIAVWWLLSLFNIFVGFVCAIVTGILGAYYRQQIRGIFQIDPCTPKTIVGDFFSYCCCPCLAIVQEARQVEQAFLVGHKGLQQGFMETPWEKEEIREKEDEIREKDD